MNDTSPIVRCAIYTRDLSEYLKHDDADPDRQLAVCNAYIQSRACENWIVVGPLFHDHREAGTSLRRPALESLLNEIALRRIDRLVVERFGCLTPSFKDLSSVKMVLDYAQCALVDARSAIDTAIPAGSRSVSMLTRLSCFEQAVMGERMVFNRRPGEHHINALRSIIVQMQADEAQPASVMDGARGEADASVKAKPPPRSAASKRERRDGGGKLRTK